MPEEALNQRGPKFVCVRLSPNSLISRPSAGRRRICAAPCVAWGSLWAPCRARTVLRFRSPKIRIPSVSSVLTVSTNRSAKQFALGYRGGILTVPIPAPARTASNEVVHSSSVRSWRCSTRTIYRTQSSRSAGHALAEDQVEQIMPGAGGRRSPQVTGSSRLHEPHRSDHEMRSNVQVGPAAAASLASHVINGLSRRSASAM